MMVHAGETDVSTYFVMRLDSDGALASSLTPTDFDLQYTRSGATASTKVDATALGSVGAAHSDNTVIECDSASSKGLYRIDWPDAAFATGVREVILAVTTPTATELMRVEIDPPVNTRQINSANIIGDGNATPWDGA